MDERLRGVAEFVDVVESGSFAAAALRLGVTRSAVAKVVARLERRLGARLLQRTTRQLGLTDEGPSITSSAGGCWPNSARRRPRSTRGSASRQGGCASACRCCSGGSAWRP